MYYAFREETFCYPIEYAEVKDGRLYIAVREGLTDEGMVLYSLFKDLVTDPELKKALLAWQDCCSAALYVEDLRKKLSKVRPRT